MGCLIKKDSAVRPLVFLMVDATDHVTGKTGLSPTVTISKNGGSFAAPSGSVSEIGSGWYKVAANATDSNTLGPLLLHATASGADPVDDRFDVVAVDPDTASVASNLSQILGASLTESETGYLAAAFKKLFDVETPVLTAESVNQTADVQDALDEYGAAVPGDEMALNEAARNAVAAALLDLADGVETGVTLRQALQRAAAVLAGPVSGAGTGTEIFVGLDGLTPRVQVSTDIAGNRSSVEYDPE